MRPRAVLLLLVIPALLALAGPAMASEGGDDEARASARAATEEARAAADEAMAANEEAKEALRTAQDAQRLAYEAHVTLGRAQLEVVRIQADLEHRQEAGPVLALAVLSAGLVALSVAAVRLWH